MVKHELYIVIQRPVAEVFAFVSDLSNGPQWQTGLLESRNQTQGSLGIGSKFASVRKFLGRKVEGLVEITEYEPNSKFVIKSASGTAPFEETYLFEPTSNGTKLSTVFELHTSGLMGLAEPMIVGSLKREMDADFGDLKDLLETRIPENTAS
ncbi:MAG: SRPBCC family protein [Anaerolineaceae bacterium]|nr:SRPBCC family protein [Anaerolineaceae bacterium]